MEYTYTPIRQNVADDIAKDFIYTCFDINSNNTDNLYFKREFANIFSYFHPSKKDMDRYLHRQERMITIAMVIAFICMICFVVEDPVQYFKNAGPFIIFFLVGIQWIITKLCAFIFRVCTIHETRKAHIHLLSTMLRSVNCTDLIHCNGNELYIDLDTKSLVRKLYAFAKQRKEWMDILDLYSRLAQTIHYRYVVRVDSSIYEVVEDKTVDIDINPPKQDD